MGIPLILTGWGVDHACASAVLLRRHPNAAVRAVSKRKLVDALREAVAHPLIMIVGVGLQDDPDGLQRTLEELSSADVVVAWYSIRPLPEELTKRALPLTPRIFAGARRLVDAVVEDADNGADIEVTTWLSQLPRSTPKNRPYVQLLEAAMSHYRRFGDTELFPNAIRHIAERRPLTLDQRSLIEEFETYGYRELRGSSPGMTELKRELNIVGIESRCRVLITGETGTGKETAAYLLHRKSLRAEEPFWAFNCADLTPQLLESRLFGYEKGAFTGALTQREGAFKLADKGTLFLDEVGELSLEAQAGLLRVLQEQRFRRLGGDEELKVDVRIISATNRNLERMVADGTFRMDLFYRLSTVHIHVPPLRARLEDLEDIANDYLYRKGAEPLTRPQVKALMSHHWPGNIRELQNILERALIFKVRDYQTLLPSTRRLPSVDGDSERLRDHLLSHVKSVYEGRNENKAQTAKALGITVNTLKKYLADLDAGS